MTRIDVLGSNVLEEAPKPAAATEKATCRPPHGPDVRRDDHRRVENAILSALDAADVCAERVELLRATAACVPRTGASLRVGGRRGRSLTAIHARDAAELRIPPLYAPTRPARGRRQHRVPGGNLHQLRDSRFDRRAPGTERCLELDDATPKIPYASMLVK